MRVLVEAVLGLARYNGNPPTDTTGMTPRELYTADFAVTGRGAYERFRALRISDADLIARARAESREQGTHTTYSDAMLQAGVRAALDRVYQVAWALRGPVAHRREHRRRLGWIGVSGEDDPPARPVNVPSAEFPQYEIDVPVGGSRVKTRFMIASPSNDPHSATFNPRALPPDFTPIVPDGDRVLLFIHGHSSRLEEALSLVPHLHALGRSRGRRYSIIAVDLPSCGYSEFLDHEAIAPKRPTRYDHPILEFIEEFLIAFVEQLDARTPIRNRIDAVIGGSLGGNMSLRLGRWAGTRLPWLRTVVSWSPASVWDSLLASSFDPFKKKACDDTWAGAIEKESSQTRAGFFKAVFDKDTIPLLLGAQPELWFRDGWRPCKENSIRRARYERFEIYHPQHRRWHWRVAHEQLVFSHRDPYTERGVPSYQAIGARTLLAAGSEDNFIGTNIYDATRGLAVLLRNAPGEGLFLRDTGHSIHAERPGLFAEHIAAFLPPPRPDGLQGEQWTRWESIGGSLTSEPVFQEQEDGRLCIFGRGQDGRPCFTVESAPGTRFEGWRALTDNLGTDERVEEPMAVGANEDGRLQLFATLGDRVVHVSQTAPNARWGAWEKGNAFSQLIGGAAPGVAVVERVGSGPSRLLLAISRRQN
ncbi:MAG: alpha/beta fold hydrolase, partial [Pseudomonadota bacterium]